MAATQTSLSSYTKLFIILLHFGCFLFTPSDSTRSRTDRKLLSSARSFLNRVFSRNHRHITLPSINFDDDERTTGSRSGSGYPLTRGEISELHDGDPSKNVVSIIFNSGWTGPRGPPRVHRILKIHNGPKKLARFEEYRELAKSNELLRFHCTTFVCDLGQKADRLTDHLPKRTGLDMILSPKNRIGLSLSDNFFEKVQLEPIYVEGQNGNSVLCANQFCSVCGIVRGGFSAKLDGIATQATGWKAHTSVPDDMENEFAFMSVKRAILVCRVVSGRVGCDPVEKDRTGFDSSVRSDGEDELVVFNPRAVLPCFVIVYSV